MPSFASAPKELHKYSVISLLCHASVLSAGIQHPSFKFSTDFFKDDFIWMPAKSTLA
jgi:hypothetical protein